MKAEINKLSIEDFGNLDDFDESCETTPEMEAYWERFLSQPHIVAELMESVKEADAGLGIDIDEAFAILDKKYGL
ncbi:MAG: hypothetical protein LBV09_02825 [Deferribacteraceae bacterium]|nr:hypothetical protein [Deferribacteraceae bacterium]